MEDVKKAVCSERENDFDLMHSSEPSFDIEDTASERSEPMYKVLREDRVDENDKHMQLLLSYNPLQIVLDKLVQNTHNNNKAIDM